MCPKCRKCGDELVVGKNWTKGKANGRNFICKSCVADYDHKNYDRALATSRVRVWRHSTGRQTSIEQNKTCPSFLGVHVAERVLSRVFKDVKVMPYGNLGYDVICNHGKRIDVKSSCVYKEVYGANRWRFTIRRNKIADYFLCLAFDNRNDLNPLYMWLIPANNVNHLYNASIRITALDKWDKHKLNIEKVIDCCARFR